MFSLLFLAACSEFSHTNAQSSVFENEDRESSNGFGGFESGLWANDFPSHKDLAILFELFDDPMISAGDLTPVGRTFLPPRWLYNVSQAFKRTDVGAALDEENRFEDWRVVSMRVVPCQPLGVMPAQTSDVLCWPTLRLVWQPVVKDVEVSWGRAEIYADDRAIHAIYPLQPRSTDGQLIQTDVRNQVAVQLKGGQLEDELPVSLLTEFEAVRDTTAQYFLNRTEDLRSTKLEAGNWDGYGVRPEVYMDESEQDAFKKRIRDFVGEFALPNDLVELTAFSLPEGRSPAHSDIWVFLQFEGREGEIYQNEMTILSREDGQEIANVGLEQTVSMGVEDDALIASIESGNAELEAVLIIDSEDVAQLGEQMADPDQFFVPNTSCASCHRLNDTRFDFHSLSHLEDGNTTISPRVVGDVERELMWVRTR
ncbi:MAG: hypothetical protein VXZ96_01415 [Myxococcota bacterium]|nr:hypothetical protein [Myxococcota bacterium]MEC8378947.1 hypothetical protein [Myxococcota bacterium]